MQNARLGVMVGLGLMAVLAGEAASALPGQTVGEATAWIQANSILQPASGETLMVRKSDTPARRFIFEAINSPPGRATIRSSQDLIRSEKLTLFDQVNGVSRDRLENSLLRIYGPDVYQDYEQAQVVYQYPTRPMVNTSVNQVVPLMAWVQGEVRQGNRYAYWLETVQTPKGIAYSGQINVFLPEDVEKLTAELQQRQG